MLLYDKSNIEEFFLDYTDYINKLSYYISNKYQNLYFQNDIVYDKTIDKILKYFKDGKILQGEDKGIRAFINKTMSFAIYEMIKLKCSKDECINNDIIYSSMNNDTEYKLLKNELIDNIENAIKSLNEYDKSIIKALYFDDDSYKELAKRLGITENNLYKKKYEVFEKLIRNLSPNSFINIENNVNSHELKKLIGEVINKYITDKVFI